jgi:acetyltransferase (GNAT) family protein
MITFATVPSEESRDAYQWHRGFAASDDSLFPRSRQAFETIVIEGNAWSARKDNGDYLALAYAHFDQDGPTWELGGLMVAQSQRGVGLGSALMRLALGHLLFEENPLEQGHQIVAHVLKANPAPRPIIEHSLRFRLDHDVEIPAHVLPGLRANAAGVIEGDEFHFVYPDSLIALIQWLNSWTGELKNKERAEIIFRQNVSLSDWLTAFRDMASKT